MIPIPEELLEQVKRGNVLLFIGERISRDAAGNAVIDQLTAHLTARCGTTGADDLPFPDAAQDYQDASNRQALVQFLRDQLEELGNEPQRAHRLIARLTDCNVLVTTCLDRRLERAFEEVGRPLDVVIGNVDVAFEDEYKTQLYKLRGSMDRVESLILTEADYDAFLEDQASISVILQGYLASKTTLFVGYDLADEYFQRLYRKATRRLDKYVRRAYAFGESPPPRVCRWCKRNGIEVVETNATTFLEELTEQLAARARPAPAIPAKPIEESVTPLQQRPYKLLHYYEVGDAAIFFGRRQETQRLSSLIHAHRLVVFYGASGAGKTSLLLAGAIPRLTHTEPPYETIYVRVWENPVQNIRRVIRRRLPEVNLPQDGALADFLDAATQALNRTLVIVLDQFEEFFIRLSPQLRAMFIAELGALHDAHDVPVKVVLSLREDWLGSVTEVEQRIPEIFLTRMRLLPLSSDQARQAVTGPVEQLGLGYEPALVDKLLDDLMLDETAGVMPPQLQIVCSALYDARGDSAVIRLATYEQLGGAQAILRSYLDEELAHFPEGQRALARQLLGELTTSRGTRAVKSASELASTLTIDIRDLQPTLSRLIKSRLIRTIERDSGQVNYEIAHEYLIQDLVISVESRARKRAEEWLQQGLEDWRVSRQTPTKHEFCLAQEDREVHGEEILISPQKLSEIRAQYKAGQLHVRDEDRDAFELLLASALHAGQRIDYWANAMASSDAGGACEATARIASTLLNPIQFDSANKAIQVSEEFFDNKWRKQLTQELGNRYLACGAAQREYLVDSLWTLRKHLPGPLRTRVTYSKARQQVALHVREIIVAAAVLTMTSLVIGGYILYHYLQRGTWGQYGFNEVGNVSYIATTSGNERMLWALVEGKRYGRALYHSEDSGDSWELVSEKTTKEPVTDMVAGLGDHNQPLVYLGTFGMGIYVFDGETGTIELRNAGLQSGSIKDLLIDPEDHKTVYVGTGDKRGIYISTDFGSSWRQIGGNALNDESIINIAAFSNPVRIYSLTDDGRIWFGDGREPDWKLAVPEGCDPGRPAAVGCDLRFTLYGKGRVTNLAVDRENRLLYAATTARWVGVMDDSTLRWNVRFVPEAESHESTNDIAVTGGTEPFLYMSVQRQGGDSIYRSQDRGQTWDLITAPELPRSSLHPLVADPTCSNRLYVASDLGAIRTINGGEDWSRMALDFPLPAVREIHVAETANRSPSATLYLAVAGATYSNLLDGESHGWSKADYGLDAVVVRDLVSDPRNPDVLYAGVHSPRQWSVFVTEDRGQHWKLLGLPPEEFRNDDTFSLALAPINDQHAVIYAGTNGSGILSAELGPELEEIEWRQSSGVYSILEVMVPPWNAQTAYAVADGRTLVKTTNAGLGWTTIGDLPGTAPFSELEAGQDPGHLYVSMRGDGVLSTVDGGKTWVPIDEELPDHNIVSLAVRNAATDIIYALTEAGVVYRSRDAGSHWESIRENLDVTDPRELIIRQYGAPELILASDDGIYYYERNEFLGFGISQ